MYKNKLGVARLSIMAGAMLTTGKLVVGLAMNSISVISEAVHSGLDLIAALITYISIWFSIQPADEKHRYGHGKFENLAAIIEALLIICAGVLIIFQAVSRLKDSAQLHALDLGAAIMGISAAINFIVSSIIMRAAKETESPALVADAWHLRTDVYTSVGVLAGIITMRFTNLYILDPLIALGVTLLIFKAANDLLRESLGSILDVRLPETEEKIIKDVLSKYSSQFIEFHDLRTRRSGSERHIDLHLVLPCCLPLGFVHELCDRIEEDLHKNLNNIQVLIHTEPCQFEGLNCQDCRIKAEWMSIYERNTTCRCDKCLEGEKKTNDT